MLFRKNKNINQKKFTLTQGLSIELPNNWLMEQEENDTFILYPDNSELTVRITPFTVKKDKKEAPVSILKESFLYSLKNASDLKEIKIGSIKGYSGIAYYHYEIENGENIFALYSTMIKPGKMININIYSKEKREALNCLNYFYKIKEESK